MKKIVKKLHPRNGHGEEKVRIHNSTYFYTVNSKVFIMTTRFSHHINGTGSGLEVHHFSK